VIAHESTSGIDLRDAHGCTVSANTFTIVQKNALIIGPASGRITVTGNNFSDSAIGEGKVMREPNDIAASGLTLNGASDVAISGNVFSSVTPKALSIDGATRRVVFADNVLADVKSDHTQLRDSVVADNLESAPAN
jgi:Right handed beta helix region